MDNLEIWFGKKKFEELKKEKNNLLKIKDELEILRRDEKVKRYVNLCKSINQDIKINILTDEQMADIAFDNIAINTKSSSRIYVYMGQCEPEPGVALTVYNAKNLFKDLETTREIKVPVLDNTFLEENIIITPSDWSDFEREYNLLRRKFFIYLITNTQEEAIQNIKKIKI